MSDSRVGSPSNELIRGLSLLCRNLYGNCPVAPEEDTPQPVEGTLVASGPTNGERAGLPVADGYTFNTITFTDNTHALMGDALTNIQFQKFLPESTTLAPNGKIDQLTIPMEINADGSGTIYIYADVCPPEPQPCGILETSSTIVQAGLQTVNLRITTNDFIDESPFSSNGPYHIYIEFRKMGTNWNLDTAHLGQGRSTLIYTTQPYTASEFDVQ